MHARSLSKRHLLTLAPHWSSADASTAEIKAEAPPSEPPAPEGKPGDAGGAHASTCCLHQIHGTAAACQLPPARHALLGSLHPAPGRQALAPHMQPLLQRGVPCLMRQQGDAPRTCTFLLLLFGAVTPAAQGKKGYQAPEEVQLVIESKQYWYIPK